MKTQKNKDSYYLIQSTQTNALTRFKNELKKSTFSVLFVLLKDQEDIENMFFFAIPLILDYFQILNFIFHDKVKHLWKSGESFSKILGNLAIFEMSKYYGNIIQWNVYLVIFYIFITVIFLTIINIIYVSYSFRRKKFSVIWPLIILRNFVNLAVTILFLFITEALLSMMECSYDNERKAFYHNNFEDIVCFKGIHLVHTIVAVVFNVIFMVISLIVALNFYESRISSQNKQARSNSRADVTFMINKIALQVFFSFFNTQWLLIIVTFLGGAVIAYYYIYDDPFYNKTVGNLFKVTSALYLWTCVVLIFLKLMEETDFQGGIILWLSPMPFIIFISISFSRHSLKTLLKSQIKFETSQELTDHLNFIIQLIEKQRNDKDSYLLLVGYIQKHKEICPESDCPLKQKLNKYKKGDYNDFQDSLTKLISVIHRLYSQGIKKFKKSVKLRIAYAFFLLERLNDKKKALEELSIAENLKPSFDEEFLIYRYKKIIEDNLNDHRNPDGDSQQEVDVVGIIAFETHLKTCIHFVKKAAEYHKDFWSELLEEKPSLHKLNLIGANINFTIRNARENWFKLIKINSNMPSIFKLYGKFLSNILNESENGEKYLEQFHRLVLKNYNTKQLKTVEYDNLRESSGIMFAGFSNNELGYIKKINKEFVNMFRYSEEECINQKIEIIMPMLYREYHSKFIVNYIENSNEEESDYFYNDHRFFGKTKNGFIFLLTSNVKPYLPQNLSNQNLLFFDVLKFNNKSKNKVYLMTNRNGVIKDITSNASMYLKLDMKTITERRVSINTILDKALVLHDYRKKGLEKMLTTSQGNKVRSLCFVLPIMMKSLEKQGEIDNLFEGKILTGFLVEIELLKTKIISSIYTKKLKNDIYELPMDVEPNVWKHFGKYQNTEQQQQSLSRYNSSEKQIILQVEQKPFQFKGQNIITKRLVKGEIVDLFLKKYFFEDDKSIDNSDIIQLNIRASVFHDKLRSLKKQQICSHKKSRKNLLKQIIQKEEKNKIIKTYKIFAFIWLLILLNLNTLNLTSSFANYNEIEKRLDLIENSTDIVNLVSNLMDHFYLLEFLKRSISEQYSSLQTKEQKVEEYVQNVNNIIDEIHMKIKKFDYYTDKHISNIVNNVKQNLFVDGGTSNYGKEGGDKQHQNDEELEKHSGEDDQEQNQKSQFDDDILNENHDHSHEGDDEVQPKVQTQTQPADQNAQQVQQTESGIQSSRRLFEQLKRERRNQYQSSQKQLNLPENFKGFGIIKNKEQLFQKYVQMSNTDYLKEQIKDLDFYDFLIVYDYRMSDSLSFFLHLINTTNKNRTQTLFDIQLLKDKIFSGFYFDYLLECQFLMESFLLKYEKKMILDQQIFIYVLIGVLVAVGFLIFFIYLLKVVHRKTEKILLLFLDIPRKNLLSIFKKCDNFLKFCSSFSLQKQAQKKLILMSSDEEDDFDKFIQKKVNRLKKKNTSRTNYYFYLVSRKSIIKRFRESKNKELKTLMFIFLVTFITILFGLLSMIDLANILSKVTSYSNYAYKMKITLSDFQMCFNFQKQMLLNKDFKVMGATVHKMALDCPQLLINDAMYLQKFDSDMTNNEKLSKKYKNSMYEDMCLNVEEGSQDYIDCKKEASGTLKRGFLNFHIHLQEKIEEYNKSLDPIVQVVNPDYNDQILFSFIQDVDGILQSVKRIKSVYLKNFFESITDEIKNILGTNTKIYIFLIIGIFVFLLLTFIFVIFPKANQLQKQIIVTIQLLNMIPIEVISEINTIREYLSYLARK